MLGGFEEVVVGFWGGGLMGVEEDGGRYGFSADCLLYAGGR